MVAIIKQGGDDSQQPFGLSYTEILKIQARKMCETIYSITGNRAYLDERLIESMTASFAIIRNDTRTQLVADMLEGREIVNTGKDAIANRRTIEDYIRRYAGVNEIPLPPKPEASP